MAFDTRGFRVIETRFVPPGADAITLRKTVLVRPAAAGSDHLLAHERQHVVQWAHFGVAGFLTRYLADYVRWRLRGHPHKAAYRRIGFEASAEFRARRERVEHHRRTA